MSFKIRSALKTETLQAKLFVAEIAIGLLAARFSHGWLAALFAVLLAGIALFACTKAWQFLHNLRNTPERPIASAAQGYVALRGHGAHPGGEPLRSSYNGLPVLWYHLIVENKTDNDNSVHEESSDASFVLHDDSGECAVDPTDAAVYSTRVDREVRDGVHYTHYSLLANDEIYVVGELGSLEGTASWPGERQVSGEILAAWKKDPADLLRRFDVDQDSQLNEVEWEAARQAARQQARKEHLTQASQMPLPQVKKPSNGRAFIISTIKPSHLRLRYYAYNIWHCLVFLLACAALASLMRGDVRIFVAH